MALLAVRNSDHPNPASTAIITAICHTPVARANVA